MVNIYARAALLTLLIVGAWIGFSFTFEGQRTAQLLTQIDAVIAQENATQTYLDYVESTGDTQRYCSVLGNHIQLQNEQLFPLLSELDAASQNLLSNDFETIRERFQSANAQLFFTLKKFEQKCPDSTKLKHPILYFFPDHTMCTDCAVQAKILDTIRDTCEQPIQIFAFPVNGGISTIDLLVRDYQIKTTPSLVIGERVYAGVQSQEKLTGLLGCE